MPYHPGCLSTITADDSPALPGVFVQVWNGSDGDAVVVFRAYGDAPEEANLRAQLGSDALNVHEATGLTPSQLQSRVAELEAALRELLSSTSLKEIGKSTGFRDLLVTGDDVRAGFKALGEV